MPMTPYTVESFCNAMDACFKAGIEVIIVDSTYHYWLSTEGAQAFAAYVDNLTEFRKKMGKLSHLHLVPVRSGGHCQYLRAGSVKADFLGKRRRCRRTVDSSAVWHRAGNGGRKLRAGFEQRHGQPGRPCAVGPGGGDDR